MHIGKKSESYKEERVVIMAGLMYANGAVLVARKGDILNVVVSAFVELLNAVNWLSILLKVK